MGGEKRTGLEGVRGIDFKDESRVNAGKMWQMHVGQEQRGVKDKGERRQAARLMDV